MLTAIVLSTNTILYTTCMGEGGSAVMYGENKQQAVKRMVDTAFKNCDISRSGKLLPLVSGYTPNSLSVSPINSSCVC